MAEEQLANFMSISGLDSGAAAALLEASGNNLETAIALHFDGGGGGGGGGSAASAVENAARVEARSPGGNGKQARGKRKRVPNNSTSASSASSRLKKKGGSGSSSRADKEYVDEHGIRAPIKPKMQQLVAASPPGRFHHARTPKGGFQLNSKKHAFDPFRDFNAEAQEQQVAAEGGAAVEKRMTLGKLFAPPVDLIEIGNLEETKEKGVKEGKWVLVNLQKIDVFECQTLNRDVWSNAQVKALVKEKFLFWQRQHDTEQDTPDADKYSQYYTLRDYPHIAILDPATGQSMKVFAQHQKPESFIDQLWSFLDTNKLFTEHAGNATHNNDEEKQLAAAIRASIEGVNDGAAAAYSDNNQHFYSGDSPMSGDSFAGGSSDEDDDDGSNAAVDDDDDDDPFAAFDAAAAAAATEKEASPGSAGSGSGGSGGSGCGSGGAGGGGTGGSLFGSAAAAGVQAAGGQSGESGGSIGGAPAVAVGAAAEAEPVLAPEPAADSAERFCTIRFIFPDNAKVQRRFLVSETVWSLYLFVHDQGYRHEVHDLIFGYPKKIMDKETAHAVTLESLKMKRENVHVQTIDL